MTQNINFYDPSLRTRREWFTLETAVFAISTCTIAMGIAAGLSIRDAARVREPALRVASELEAGQAELADLNQRVSEIKPDEKLQNALRVSQMTLTQRQAALELLRGGGLGNDAGHAESLSAFARQSVTGLWPTGVTLDHEQVALRGRTTSPDLIPAYVNRLNKEAVMKGRSFRALDISRPLEVAAAPPAPEASAPAAAASAVQRAPFVEFSLVSAQGAEAPAREKGAP